jgi:hypothetical protein
LEDENTKSPLYWLIICDGFQSAFVVPPVLVVAFLKLFSLSEIRKEFWVCE